MVAVPVAQGNPQQQIGRRPDNLTVEDFGDVAVTDIKDLNQIATQFFNNICKQNKRGDFCFKYIDLSGVMDKNWPNRRVDIEDVEQLKYNVTNTAF